MMLQGLFFSQPNDAYSGASRSSPRPKTCCLLAFRSPKLLRCKHIEKTRSGFRGRQEESSVKKSLDPRLLKLVPQKLRSTSKQIIDHVQGHRLFAGYHDWQLSSACMGSQRSRIGFHQKFDGIQQGL